MVSISGDHGKLVNYSGKYYKALAPKKDFWQVWHNNIGIIDEKENNYYYIKEFYEKVLKVLDIDDMFNSLGSTFALMCYEDNNEFCHRHIVAYYLELILNIEVPEVKIDEFGHITHLERPEYIRNMLYSIIREDIIKNNKVKTRKI